MVALPFLRLCSNYWNVLKFRLALSFQISLLNLSKDQDTMVERCEPPKSETEISNEREIIEVHVTLFNNRNNYRVSQKLTHNQTLYF